MNDFSVATARNSLTSKGFQEKVRDHYNFFFWHNGRKTRIHTRCSHGRTIPLRVLRKMQRQLHLPDLAALEHLLDCSMDEQAYRTLLAEQGVLS